MENENEPERPVLLRDTPLYDGFVPADGPRQEIAEAIDRHYEEHFGTAEFVWHEMGSHLIGAHVYVYGPTDQRPFRTLVTHGMSERPMTVPDGISPYAELMIALPPDWPVTAEALRDPVTGWPMNLLKYLARFPHEYGTWLGEWHGMPNGEPAEPYAPGTPFAAVVIAPMLRCSAETRVITTEDGTEINLLAVLPLHPGEIAVKLSAGTNALIEILDRGKITELLDPQRPSFA